MEKSIIVPFHKEVDLYQSTNYFELVQTESICSQQLQCDLNDKIFVERIKNIVGKVDNAGFEHPLLLQCLVVH